MTATLEPVVEVIVKRESLTYRDSLVHVDGRYAGEVSEDTTSSAPFHRFLAVASGLDQVLGWHDSMDKAVAAIVAVHQLRSAS